MTQHDWLADQFEAHRTRLRTVAFRMLGSKSEADDAVQETWLRLSRTDTSGVENLGGWLTTVVGRVCLDMLRSRKSRREQPLEPSVVEPNADPEHEVVLADSIGLALLVVLETLSPAERVAFVLHDMFGMRFEDIAPIVGRSEIAARQLASRARRRVQGAGATADSDLRRRREIVDAFLAASRGGDFDALLALLDPEVVLRADAAAVQIGADEEIHGAPEVARRLVAVVGLLGERAVDHGLQLGRGVRSVGAQRRRVVVQVRPERRLVGLALVGRAARERVEQDAAERVDVGPGVNALAADLLGGDEAERADPAARARVAAVRVPRSLAPGLDAAVSASAAAAGADSSRSARHATDRSHPSAPATEASTRRRLAGGFASAAAAARPAHFLSLPTNAADGDQVESLVSPVLAGPLR